MADRATIKGYFETADTPTGAQFAAFVDEVFDAKDKLGTAASSSGTLGTAIDTDGTLKAGAVDGSSVIADGVVTNAKMATDAKIGSLASLTTTAKDDLVSAVNEVNAKPTLPLQINLAWDALNEHYGVGESPDSRTRWTSTGTGSTVDPDTDNPFDNPTLRVTSGTGNALGKRFWLDEMGLKPGDRFQVAMMVKFLATMSFRVGWTMRNSGGTVVGTTGLSALTAGTGALQWIATTATSANTVHADAATIDVYCASRAGTGDIDIYAMAICKGNDAISQDIIPLSIDDGRRAMALLEAAKGSKLTLDARLDVALNEDGTLKSGSSISAYPASALAYGRGFLRSWSGQLGKIRYGDTEQAVVVLIGDSWVNGEWRMADPLIEWLQAEYGDAGPGWVSVQEGTKGEPPNMARSRTGPWTDRNHTTTPKGRGPDMSESMSTDTATPAKLTYTATFRTAKIHYLVQSGGGSFRWQIDSGGWTTVNTSGVSDTYAVETISGLSDASHTLEIDISVAGANGVVLFGVDFQELSAGVRLHKLGQGGAKASDCLALNETLFADAVDALDPDLLILLFGTNDDSGDVAPETFQTNMEGIASRVRDVYPLCDILYLAPSDNGLTPGTYTMTDYVQVLRDSAVTNSYAMFDSYLLLGSYADANSRGLYSDTAHINMQGGRTIAHSLIRDLLWIP